MSEPSRRDRLEGLSPAKRALLLRTLRAGAARDAERQRIRRRGPGEAWPLSSGQQRLWFLAQMEPASPLYNIPTALRIEGRLDAARLARALTAVVVRHEVLRTELHLTDDGPRQRVRPPRPLELPLIDLRSLPAARREAEAVRLAAVEAERPFDLGRAPLLRARLVRLGERDHLASLTVHHVVSDAWSKGILVRDLTAAYRAAEAPGEVPSLPPLPIQYADFAVWQRELLEGGELDRQLAYWRAELTPEPPSLDLPLDRPRPPVQSFRGASRPFGLSASLAGAAHALARREGTTLFVVLLAAFQSVLHRYSGQLDVTVGSPLAGRNRPETADLIGFFVNTVVLRTRFDGDPSFAETVRRAHRVTVGAADHQDLPFERLVDELQPTRDLSRTPLFQVMIVLQNLPQESLDLPGLSLRAVELRATRAKFDLTVSLVEAGDRLLGGIGYMTALFDRATVDRLAGHLQALLEAGTANPDLPVARLGLLTAGERHQLLREWSGTPSAGHPGECLHQGFARVARSRPDSIAASGRGGSLTYGELAARAHRLAHHLLALGVGPEEPVALLLERSVDLVVAMIAVLEAGAAYLPLDPTHPAERSAAILEDARAAVVITERALREALPAGVLALVLEDEAAAIAARPARSPGLPTVPGQAAYVIFTSGSTGRPKGVVVPHSNVGRLVEVSRPLYGYDAGAVWSVFHSFAFDYSVWEIWGALLTGARAVIVDLWTRRNPPAFLELLRRERVTLLSQTPSAFRPLIAAALEAGAGDLALESVVFAGEALEPVVLEPWIGRWGDERPRLVNMYGITETTVHTTFRRMVAADAGGPSLVGGALPEWRIQLLDRRGEPVPAGVAGEICVGGAGLARGYLHRPALTAGRFVPDPYAAVPGDRLYRSGDLARWRADGDLEYLGRIDHQIKIRGFRIEPGEIATALIGHPSVGEAVVVARDEPSGARRLVAYVVPAAGRTADAAELRGHLSRLLPEHMVPSAFVLLTALPLTANGKVDRRALPAPEAVGGASFTAPRTPAEEALAAVWAEVLRAERVGIHDNFFELGGDSILSIQIVSRAARAGVRITPRQMFQHQTVAELAAVAGTAEVAVAEQGPVVGELPLTPIQAWFFAAEPVDAHHHNQATMFEVGPELALAELLPAAAALLGHHDALRLRFEREAGGRWRQRIVPPEGPPPVTAVDLSALPEERRTAALERAGGAVQASLDLGVGPLVRFVLFTRGRRETSRLLIAAHHLTVDGVSWRILIEDLGTALERVRAGDPVALPPKTTSYKAWAERLAAAGERFAAQLEEWTGAAAAPRLPVDHPDGDDAVGSTRSVGAALEAEETAALLQEVPRAYRTRIDDALLTAVATALGRWTGERRVRIDLEGHGREELFDDVDLSRTVGWFTSIYPVELDLSAAGGPGAALCAVKERLRAVPDRGVGYGVLRHLGDAETVRRLAAAPPAEVSFNYLGQLDQAVAAGGPLAPAREGRGALVSPRQRRRYRLDFGARVAGGRLLLSCGYGSARYRRETVQALIESVRDELRLLIEHCLEPGAGGPTPSDFPLAGLDQAALDRLAAGVEVEEIYPLSPLQEGFLFHAVHTAEAASYRQQLSCRLVGELDAGAFAAAWQEVIDRHPILRTSFAWRGLERPVQVVHRRVPVAIAEEDWSGAPEDERRRRLDEHLAADRERPFDLESPCVMRLALIRLAPGDHAFTWSFHHILWDGWSFPMLIGEVFAAYRARVAGDAIELPARRPYRDYIAWLEEQSLAAAEAHWRGVLRGFSAPTPLTAAAIPPRRPERTGAHQTRVLLGEEVTAALDTAARRLQLTLNTLVQGALAALLGRYTGERDVVFGVVSSGRSLPLAGIEQMIGLFINTLPARVGLAPDQAVDDWLRGIQEQQTESRQFEHSPLAQVQGWSSVPRGQALFEVLLAFENFPADESMRAAGGGGLRVADVRFVEATNYPLAVMVTPGPRLAVRTLFDPARWEEADVRRLIRHLGILLEQIAEPGGRRLGGLAVLSAAERHQLLHEWNDTARPLAPRLLHEAFEERAAAAPDAPAVSFGAVEIGYGELNRRANRLARHLRRLGVGPGTWVGIHLERSAEMVEALLAVSKAGGCYVPVDVTLPVARTRFILGSLGAACLLTQSGRLPHLAELWPAVPALADVVCLDEGSEAAAAEAGAAAGETALPRRWSRADLAALPDGDPAPVGHPEDPAYVIFTSGSTGTPKGVVVRHRPVANLVDWVNRTFGVGPGDRILFITSLSFDLSVYDVFGLLAAGGSIRVAAAGDLREPERLVRYLLEDGVTFWDSAPAALQQLVPAFPAEPAAASSLRLVFLSGDWVPVALPERVRAAFPRAGVVALGGATEATVWSNFHRTGERDPRWVSVPYGRPIANARYHVLDERLEPCPIGVAGDLHIGGPVLASGYTDAVASARQFLPDPWGRFDPRAEPPLLYRTGDRARLWPDGRIEFLGRLDHQVKVRGFRIELGEIEAVLSALPGVRDAVVLARRDRLGETGTEHARLVAYVVPAAGAAPEVGELRSGVAEQLPEHMVPVAFVILDELPVTANGKLDRKALPAPEAARPELGVGFAAPRSPVEARLAEIWTRVLPVDSVGIHDDFFELGGDSILSLQIVSRANQAGLRLTTTQLFTHPTVAGLAAVIGEADAAPELEEREAATGEVPLTPAQLWFFAGDLTDAHHFNLSLLLELEAPPPPVAVARAVDHLAAHHEALRLRFTRDPGGGWRQDYAPPPVAGGFLCLDLGCLPPASRAAALEAAAARTQVSLDLAGGPLLRVVLARFGPGEPARLLLVTHHLVSDGVSLRVLLEDLGAAVASLAAGRPPEPPVRTASYRRWAEHLVAAAESEALRAELPFWLDPRRAEVPPLPRDGEREPGRAGDQRRVVVALDADQTAALLQQVPRAYRTQINDALLAALGEALARWTGTRLALIELEGHGREAVGDETVDVSRTVGWFTSFVPVLLDLRRAVGPGDALKTVKETLRSMPARGIGHGLLRRLAGGAERLAELPEPEISFNYLGQLDSTQPEGLPMRPARENAGPAQSPRRRRRYLLDVECRVSGGRLVASLRYSERCHRRETIEGLAEGFLAALRELVEHCGEAGEGGATPSDFPLTPLDQPALDRLLAEHGPVEDLYPLSPLQRGMLFHTLRDGESGVYVQQLTCSLYGELDADAFAAAWQRLADRQPVLRTAYVWQHLDEPLQVVAGELRVVLRRLDWRDRGDAERHAGLAELLDDERRRGFDVERAPLMRLVLIRFADDAWRFVWTHHHLLLDGWSLPLLVRELFALYEGERRGEPVDLPRARPYRDYVAWLAARDRGAAEAFWRRYLAGFNRPTPIDGRGPAGRAAGAPETRDLPGTLPAAASEALARSAQRRQLTLNTLVQGAWGLVLARSGGGSDVVYGVVSSGRPPELPGVETMLGMFIATVPARVRVQGERTAGEWLRALQADQVEARRHEHASLSEIQGWSEVPRGEPLFESLLVFENYPVGEALSGERRMSVAVRDLHMEERTNYPLNLTVMPGPSLRLLLSYDARRFTATAAERLLRRFETVLLALAGDPDRRLDQVPALTPAERHQVLHEWNDTRIAVPPGTLHEALARGAAERSDAVAVEHGGLALSYGELTVRAVAAAAGLRRRGVGPEVRVGVYLDRRPELAVALLGVLRAGGAYLPLDPALPAERLRAMAEESGVRVLVTRERLRRAAAELGAGAVVTIDGDLRAGRGEAAAEIIADPGADALAYLLYTSGSTGVPKAVLVTHGSLVNHGTNAVRAYGLEPGDRVLQFSSIGFDMLAEDLFPTWLAGATVVFPAEMEASSPRDLSDFVERAGLSVLNLPTAHWSEWLADLETGRRPLPASLRMMVIGSEALPRERAEAWRRLTGERVAWRNAYGVTEATVAAAIHRPAAAGPVPAAEAGETVPIGRAIANFALYVLDPDLRPVPIGAAGELCIGGAGVARGYARRPALTAERFVPDPHAGEPGRRLYRTGDLVRSRADGEVEFLGRIDHQVKVRGFRIEPGEIEAELSALPAVREAVVLLRHEGGDPHLVAYLVPAVAEVSIGELRSALRRRLPDYMVPAAFVVLATLPLTANGKVDRRALPVPEAVGTARDRELVPPSNETERIVAAVWREVLGAAEIGIHDDFFDLGGHSLLATRVLTRVRDAFDVELTLRDVFEHPTVARFAEHVLSRRLEREDAGELGELVAELEGLSEEEVAALLAEDEDGDVG